MINFSFIADIDETPCYWEITWNASWGGGICKKVMYGSHNEVAEWGCKNIGYCFKMKAIEGGASK